MKHKNYTEILSLPPDALKKRQKTKGCALSFVGLIVYGILRLFQCKPRDYLGICPYFEIGKNWGGLEMGWFFICCKDCGCCSSASALPSGTGSVNCSVQKHPTTRGGLRLKPPNSAINM